MNTEDNNDFYDDELSRSLISNDFEDDTPHRKKKSKKPLVICLIILLIAAAAGGTAWYMMQRHKPVEATEEFLTGMQNMDFTTMENLLQSHDLSALDDADIRDSAYTDFFTTVNKKMTYKITKNKFDIQNGTARITVHMKYIDGTNIYAATIQEYTRKIAVAAYAGKEMTQDDIQEMLAALLAENASTADEKYSCPKVLICVSLRFQLPKIIMCVSKPITAWMQTVLCAVLSLLPPRGRVTVISAVSLLPDSGANGKIQWKASF